MKKPIILVALCLLVSTSASAKILDPAQVTEDQAISGADLYETLSKWKNKSVKIHTYCKTHKTEAPLGRECQMVPTVETFIPIGSCRMKNKDDATVYKRETPFVLTATIYDFSAFGRPRINFRDCEVASTTKPAAVDDAFTAATLSADKVVSIEKLFETAMTNDYLKWYGKFVTVTGGYKTRSESKLSSGTFYKVKVSDPATNTNPVYCDLGNTDPGPHESGATITVKGKVDRLGFKDVTLKECKRLK